VLSGVFLSFFLPNGKAGEGDDAWLVARHTGATHEECQEAGVTESEARSLFYNYEMKCISSGVVSAANAELICASLSCTHGAYSAPLLVKEFDKDHLAGICMLVVIVYFVVEKPMQCFLGVGAPSADGDVSYNRFLSVNHPVFVHNYAKFIVPDLPMTHNRQ